MGRVHLLPDELRNQIAAGEVVERPASVIKELVENSIDAGATRISVSIDEGGVRCMRVSDDGSGMDPEDAELAVARHATSKIRAFDDLLALDTFGFRGEALPSIASVSKFSLLTRTRERDEGVLVEVDGGGNVRTGPAGGRPGTTVTVADLFFNVPARRKFLKRTATESAYVSEVVMLAALARPQVTFFLERDGRRAKEFLRAPDRASRAAQAFPEESLAPCIAQRDGVRIEAYLSAPERARSGAVALHVFVNGRPVRDRHLARAVAQAYGSVLNPGSYPVGAVYIDLPPELVDVNVHPQKAEVRFRDARALFDSITRELHPHLARAFAIPAGPLFPRYAAPSAGAAPLSSALMGGKPSGAMLLSDSNEAWGFDAGGAPSPLGETPSSDLGGTEPGAERADTLDGALSTTRQGAEPPSFLPAGASGAATQPTANFAYGRLRYLGQAHGTYLVCEGADGLYVLDQHAAAERVTFDRLKRAFRDRAIATQQLLVADVIPLTPGEVALLTEHADEVAALGVELRAVGSDAVAVHAVPQILRKATPERLVRDVLAELGRAARRPFSDAVDLVLATMACHGSVRAGDVLSADEARALLQSMDGIDFSGHCPHGRPVLVRLTFSELERGVGRSA